MLKSDENFRDKTTKLPNVIDFSFVKIKKTILKWNEKSFSMIYKNYLKEYLFIYYILCFCIKKHEILKTTKHELIENQVLDKIMKNKTLRHMHINYNFA